MNYRHSPSLLRSSKVSWQKALDERILVLFSETAIITKNFFGYANIQHTRIAKGNSKDCKISLLMFACKFCAKYLIISFGEVLLFLI